ncbi:hypothetical protein HNP02_003182 [Mycobacterium sp. AZCC_0083]|nr:hypothetical protein [Mycobacterium sp. AZCC_0083]
MAILTPDLNVEVYNADYRALPQIPWQPGGPADLAA